MPHRDRSDPPPPRTTGPRAPPSSGPGSPMAGSRRLPCGRRSSRVGTGARIVEPLVVRVVEDDDAVAGLLEQGGHVDEPSGRRVDAVHQADRRPPGIIRAVGCQRPHAVILMAACGLDAPRGQLNKPPLPLGAAVGCKFVLINRDHHHSRPKRETNFRPQTLAKKRLGQRSGQASGRQCQLDRRPLDRRAAGLGQSRDDLGNGQPSRLLQGDLDAAFRGARGHTKHGHQCQNLAGQENGVGHHGSARANSGQALCRRALDPPYHLNSRRNDGPCKAGFRSPNQYASLPLLAEGAGLERCGARKLHEHDAPAQSRRVRREDAPGALILTERCVVENSTHPTVRSLISFAQRSVATGRRGRTRALRSPETART